MTIDSFLSSPAFIARKEQADRDFVAISMKRKINQSVYDLLRNDISSYLG